MKSLVSAFVGVVMVYVIVLLCTELPFESERSSDYRNALLASHLAERPARFIHRKHQRARVYVYGLADSKEPMQKPRHGREDKRLIDLLVSGEKKTHQRVVLVKQYVNEDVLNARPGNLKIEPAVIKVNKQYHGMQKANAWGKRKLGQRGKVGAHNRRKGTHGKAKGLHKLSSNVIASKVDTECPPLHYQEPAASTVVALASIHGSGSVWLRHLIQQATRK